MEFILTIAIAFIITVLVTPLTIKMANNLGLVDDPKLRPHPAHIQKRIIPRAGGLPIYIGIILTALLTLSPEKYLWGIFAGITLLLIIGLVDDKLVKFSPYTRLILLFAASAMAVAGGAGISFISNPFMANSIIRLDQLIYTINFFGPHSLIIIADLFALFWIVTVTQIVNWSKGVDGQMPSITLVTALILGLLSLKFYFQGDPNQLNIAKLSFIVAGTSAGFLIFNWHPSKILPGFSGSTILAFMLAVLAILSSTKVATALLVLAIPTTDFLYTFLRRIAHGNSPVWPDRGHLHHRLLDLGWSHQKISLFYMLGSAILGATALFINTGSKVFVTGGVAALFLGFILWLNFCGGSSKQQGPDNG